MEQVNWKSSIHVDFFSPPLCIRIAHKREIEMLDFIFCLQGVKFIYISIIFDAILLIEKRDTRMIGMI